jgi:hypothetical protein
MMSKERETLITDLSINAVDGFFYITQELQSEIRELLAKPEAITPREGLTEYKKGYAKAELDLKREPLSDEEVFDIGYKAGFAIDQDESADYESEAYGFLNGDGYVDNEPYFKLVRAIEKAHGIGGGE